MAQNEFDIVILTQKEYLHPKTIDHYTQNILTEDQLLTSALERKGFKVGRTNWDNPDFDWSSTPYALFRATWDYFHRFQEFNQWLKKTSQVTSFINPLEIIEWSSDKHYLKDLKDTGINIPPTEFIEIGDRVELASLMKKNHWTQAILKPAIAGGARQTYLLNHENVAQHQDIFQDLIAKEAMLLQAFQEAIYTKGEMSYMVFGNQYSHAVLKKARAGDFRVQDDFGGQVFDHQPSQQELAFIEKIMASCPYQPIYARLDVMWDNQMQLCLSELELIEPELWFRKNKASADLLAEAIQSYVLARNP